MLRNFFKSAYRNILTNRAYALINFVGLTAGLALSLLIIVYIRSELSYDEFHTKADRLYRVSYLAPNGLKLASSPPPIAPRMAEFFPDVEAAARVYGRSISIKRPDAVEAFEETGVFFADSTLTSMMTFDFVKGDPVAALRDEFTVVITEEMATKYFGNAEPLGQTLLFAGQHEFTVAGVVREFPNNSHWSFNMLIPYENMFDMETDETAQRLRDNLAQNFVISHSYTYVLLKEGGDPGNVDAAFGDFVKKYADPRLQVGQVFTLIAVPDIHLHSDALAEPSATNTMSNIMIFLAVGMLTIIVACINYVNLSTAQSFTRIKEIGIRKILGSQKYQIILQFLAESFLFCAVAIVLSFGVFYLALPLLNQLTNKELVFVDVVDAPLLIASLALLAIVTLLAGGYPAWFVARFDSISGLKGEGGGLGNQWLRKVLIVFQLTVACVLLSASLLIFKQMNFLSSRALGFKRDQIITIPLFSQNLNGLFNRQDSVFRSRLQSFRDQVEGQTGVSMTALSSNAPGLGAVYRGTIPEGFAQEDNLFTANLSVDYNFFNTYEFEFVAGRPFSRDFPSDVAEGFIINETAIQEFKWEGTPESVLGKTINREGKIGKVVGVIRDVNFVSLQSPISGLLLELNPNAFNILSVRFDNSQQEETIAKVEALWNSIFPEKTFQYTFLDVQLNQQYANFRNFGTIIQSFTFIAILISCLGVYGLVLFIVRRKVKEIGVRKVLGASVGNILRLIYADFGILLAIGFVVAVPASYYLMSKWLENFTYHTSIDVWTYLLSLLIVVVITGLTVSYRAVEASMANPVKSLRTE